MLTHLAHLVLDHATLVFFTGTSSRKSRYPFALPTATWTTPV